MIKNLWPGPAAEIAALTNSGMFVLNPQQGPRAERTLVVLGIARSGTTMVAGSLHHLGILVADPLNAVFEDMGLAQAMEARDLPALKTLIAARNAAHGVWAWKRPSILQHIRKVEGMLRNPEYIVVFRDLLAIANRNRISVFSDLVTNLQNSYREVGQLVEFVAHCRSPALLVSYEKAMENPDRFVEGLADFAGVTSPTRLAQARVFIRREPEEYLRSSRVVRGVGKFGPVERDVIAGWAYADGQERPATVQIRVNDRELATILADRDRPDVRRKGLHPTGVCGFRLELPARKHLRTGDVVSARVVGDIQDIFGSPRRIKDEADDEAPRRRRRSKARADLPKVRE